jgi:hypothetical protein
MALQAPIERLTHRVLRAAVLDLIETEPRRHFPAVIHAGVPGTGLSHVVATGSMDAGLRADVALTMLHRAADRVPRPYMWLTRPGQLSVHDEDLQWLGPVAWASASLGHQAGLVVVTRRGWFDPVSDVRREWRRLRRRPPGAG